MIKKYSLLLGGGFLGGFFAVFLIFNLGFFNRTILDNLKTEMQKAGMINQILPSPSPERIISGTPDALISYSPAPADFWQKIVIGRAFNFAAVQSFKESRLLRQGNGIFLSSDGLIVTVSDVVPASASVFQVLYEDKILRGKIVARDYAKNLAIIRVSGEADFNVPELDLSDNFQSGQELLIAGKFVNLSKPILFSQKTLINYMLDKTIFLDVQPKNIFNGGALVNNSGRIAGMTFIRGGRTYSVNSVAIDAFLKNYLNQTK